MTLFQKIANELQINKSIQVQWFWEPYFRSAKLVTRYASNRNIAENKWRSWLDELSTPSVPKDQIRHFSSKIVACDGRLLPLSPQTLIENGLKESPKNEAGTFISNLVDFLERTDLGAFTIEVDEPVSKSLTNSPETLKKFQELPLRRRMEVIEIG